VAGRHAPSALHGRHRGRPYHRGHHRAAAGLEEVDAPEIGAGVAVLVLRKISYDTDDRPVEVADVVMPGDRTELVYTTDLKRWPA